MQEIRAIGNEQRYAVRHIKSGDILLVAPSETYCIAHAERHNEDFFPVKRYEVIPYNEPRKPERSSAIMSAYPPYIEDDMGVYDEYEYRFLNRGNLPPDKEKETAKSRVQKYLDSIKNPVKVAT